MSRRAGALAALGGGAVLVAAILLVAPFAPTASTHGRLGADVPAGAGSGSTDGSSGAGAGDAASGRQSAGRPVVSREVRHDTSAALRSITPGPPQAGHQEDDQDTSIPGHDSGPAAGPRDPVLQDAPVSPGIAASVVANFDGVTNINGVLPPDTNGDIGPNDYVQWVNLSFAIYDRSGTLLYGPAAGNTLWANFGTITDPCRTTNNGDPIAQYDHIADRWVMSQFALPNYPSGPFYMCIAVSETGDPTGVWNRYEFLINNTKMDDYPHLTVWPDGYYLSVNQFNQPAGTWGGEGVAAFERSKMLLGQSAQMVYFDLDPSVPAYSALGGMQPSDLDGPAPPNGAPNVYVQADGSPQNQLDLWDFHVDWANTANSSFTEDASSPIAVASMDTTMCGGNRNCIPQPPFNGNKTQGLDAISDRIMYRLQYRNFGSYQTLVTTNTVDVDPS